MEGNYTVGEQVEVCITGYDYGVKPIWILGVITRQSTAKRAWVKFKLKSGREIERMRAHKYVRKLEGGKSDKGGNINLD